MTIKIEVSGPRGCGKSTLISLLYDILPEYGIDVDIEFRDHNMERMFKTTRYDHNRLRDSEVILKEIL